MEHKDSLVTVAIAAVISSICTATIIAIQSDSATPTVADTRVIESQLLDLKAALTLETQARISLADQFNSNRSMPETTRVAGLNRSNTPAPGAAADQSQEVEPETRQQAWQRVRQQRRAERLASQQPSYRQQQLVKAGFAQEEAARIVQIESEESLRQLQRQYDNRRQQAASTNNQLANINPIRSELGEQNYERYLEANGWPTSASIGAVIGGSPGESAGLRAGDNVLSYAGERVFNLSEINNLTIQGAVGESVLIEVERDGESVQLTIPRGPIGINSGRRFGR
ncbi:MAG: C-terminal processing protease CtpA/Prc [Arenicella sp.]|jgi:C-terminal processing protease CtpA/Prc